MKIISLILFILCFSYGFSQKLRINKLTAYHYSTKEKDSEWSSLIPCNINIVADSLEVLINSKEPEYFGITSIKELEDLSLKLECIDIKGYLVDIFIKNDQGLVLITLDYYDHFITYYCKPSKNE